MSHYISFGDILAPGDAAHLINLGLVNVPTPRDGSVQIHKRRLNRTSDEENKHIPPYVNILISKATIEYVGFNSDKAREIWSGWVAWPSGPIIREIDLRDETTLEVSFIDWVKGHAGNPLSDDFWEDDSSAWFHYMEQRGIATELQVFCHPLGDVQHTNTEPSGSASGGRHTLAGPSVMHDFTVLYKTMDQARLDGLFDPQGALSRISVLRSVPPTDFSENKAIYCFTPDYNLARKHAAWVKRRGPSAVIVQIAVQDSVITAMNPPDIQCAFWPNLNWRELIWHRRTETISKETVDYGRAALIIGTIANRPNAYYHQRSPEELITEACVVRVRGPNKGGD
ncbi:hypothetical protein DER46DRAFT_646025 [Fusarium sp. MPI-SDFR-AT-0072]|nr:hypothetical protein DER46DRAFT_646025 [Fusarium sp. MPI-SDFR-AT-0072]